MSPTDLLHLDDRVAPIAGGGGAIWSAVGSACAQAGAKVVRLFALGWLMVGCAAPLPSPTPTPTPSAAPTSTQVPPTDNLNLGLPATGTALEPGGYFGSVLSLTIVFTVGPGWTHQQKAPEFFDIEQDVGSPDVIAVQFAGLHEIANATEVAGQIEAREDLTVSEREDVELDCHLGAIRLTVTPTDTSPDSPQFWPVVDVAAGTLSVASGRRLQIDIFTFHMGTALILVGGSIAHWDETLAAAQPVLDSLRLRPSGGPVC